LFYAPESAIFVGFYGVAEAPAGVADFCVFWILGEEGVGVIDF